MGSKSKCTALETPGRTRKGFDRFGARTLETEAKWGHGMYTYEPPRV